MLSHIDYFHALLGFHFLPSLKERLLQGLYNCSLQVEILTVKCNVIALTVGA